MTDAIRDRAAKREWLKVQYRFLGQEAYKPVWVWANGRDEALARASAILERKAGDHD